MNLLKFYVTMKVIQYRALNENDDKWVFGFEGGTLIIFSSLLVCNAMNIPSLKPKSIQQTEVFTTTWELSTTSYIKIAHSQQIIRISSPFWKGWSAIGHASQRSCGKVKVHANGPNMSQHSNIVGLCWELFVCLLFVWAGWSIWRTATTRGTSSPTLLE